jgi:hypothetical protein
MGDEGDDGSTRQIVTPEVGADHRRGALMQDAEYQSLALTESTRGAP